MHVQRSLPGMCVYGMSVQHQWMTVLSSGRLECGSDSC